MSRRRPILTVRRRPRPAGGGGGEGMLQQITGRGTFEFGEVLFQAFRLSALHASVGLKSSVASLDWPRPSWGHLGSVKVLPRQCQRLPVH